MTAAARAALLPILAAAFVAGLLIGPIPGIPSLALGFFTVAASLLVVLCTSLRVPVLPALALTAALLGTLRTGLEEPSGVVLQEHLGRQNTQVEGVVAQDPKGAGTYSRFRFSVSRLRRGDDMPWVDAPGQLWVAAQAPADLTRSRDPPFLRYGDGLRLTGRLEPPERSDDFDFPGYLESQGIEVVISFPEIVFIEGGGGSSFYRRLYSLRRELASVMARVVPGSESALGQSIVLGIRDNVPDGLTERFRRTGTAHLLAISGLHVGILLVTTMSASTLLMGRRRLFYLIAPMAAIWLYALLSGSSPSAIRAALMGTAYIGAIAVGRPRSLVPSLALAAALMAAVDPKVLSRASFQLSFAAMMGIGIYYEAISDRLHRWLAIAPWRGDALAAVLRSAVGAAGVTLAATAATAPLLALHFGQVPVVGPAATLLTLPALPLALVASGASAAVGTFSELVATPIGWLAWGLLSYVIGVVSLFARFPGATLDTGGIASMIVWMYYAAMLFAAFTIYVPSPRRNWRRWVDQLPGDPLHRTLPWQVLAIAIVGCVLVWMAALAPRHGVLRVVFADVGQGDMTVITTPSGSRVVIDGGPDRARAVEVLGGEMNFWENAIDLQILTHPHNDHVIGLNEVLARYEVSRIIERRQAVNSPEYTEWIKLASAESARIIEAIPGTTVSFDDGVSIQIVNPPNPPLAGTDSDEDNASVVVRVVYGDSAFLITGDVFHEAEAWMIRSGIPLDSDVLKLAHHGSRTSSTAEFLQAVAPAVAVIPVAEDNRFGHPHQEVIDRLKSLVPPPRVLLTGQRGSVTFETDGDTLRLWTSR